MIPPERIWILTNQHLRDTIVKQLPDVPARQILAEPAQRNTAPAIGLAAHILESIDPGAVMGVFPADHVIAQAARLPASAEAGDSRGSARQDRGLGNPAALGRDRLRLYRVPARRAGRDRSNRRASCASARSRMRRPRRSSCAPATSIGTPGCFSGVLPCCWTLCASFCPRPRGCWIVCRLSASRGFAKRLGEIFPQCENISIDYAVLERSPNVVGPRRRRHRMERRRKLERRRMSWTAATRTAMRCASNTLGNH